MALIAAPSVILALDDTVDTSFFYSLQEEEENGKTKNILSPFSIENNDFNASFRLLSNQLYGYRLNNYLVPHLNLISPPPEQNI